MNQVSKLNAFRSRSGRASRFWLTRRGVSTNRDDYDVLLMQEFKNYAAFDGIKAKTGAIEENVIGSLDKQNQILAKRVEVREVLGSKTMQELLPK
jgi:hypothetical protein